MEIRGRKISTEVSPYIVLEVGAGHNGKLEDMFDIIDAALKAGADAIKLQTYTPDSLTIQYPFTIDGGEWAGKDLWGLYEAARTPEEWLPELFQDARTRGYTLFSTPFAPKDVDLLEKFCCPAYKIASAEIAHIELLMAVRQTGKPVIVSTGAANREEVATAFTFMCGSFETVNWENTALLHCVSGYPTPIEEANLWRVKWLRKEFGPTAVGFSDHTPDYLASAIAVSQGASIIEKHIALAGSADEIFGLRPYETTSFIQEVRNAWAAMQMTHAESEEPFKKLKRSIYVTADIPAGEILTPRNVAVIRPAGGLHPRDLPIVLGRKIIRDLKRGEPLAWNAFADGSIK